MTTPDLLRLAIVGHTNTGKTSLMRTLLEDRAFGEVQNAPGTTRHVEGATIQIDNQATIELHDTPGIEDSIGLWDYLDQLQQSHPKRLDGPDSIHYFLTSPESHGRFEQEARVLRQLLQCDAGLYVVDIRDPVLAKHKDELAILARCGKPLIAILNFIHSPQNHLTAWRDTLARLGIHMSIEFDTVAPAIDGKEQLYQKLALVLDKHSPSLTALAEQIKQQRQLRKRIAFTMLASTLIDVAAFKVSTQTDAENLQVQSAFLQETIRKREHQFIKDILKHYRFAEQDYPTQPLPIQGERWGMDLFHPDALVDMGIQVGKGFAAGAAAGATIDVFTGGLSLGAAALLGGVVGSVWQGFDKVGKRLIGKIQGYEELSVDDAVIRLLGLRGLQLIDILEKRGHAAQHKITLDQSTLTQWQTGKLPESIHLARAYPSWSSMSSSFENSADREQAINNLSKQF
ncbi:DUF3482 domain-containing protein [Pelistega sp. NLN82]|uniref:DUF3482 domain-containing protein n=1 Tax=Pelistega ratti TaxID=2652177 RepID=A0A6L9Y593_9BURK|nr:DUF3482 domain-containing protein [Pelistega ratti]NEN75539.1 DUF3482 domain-containing protein [Pelistega ratti]